MSAQYLQKEFKDELDFLHADKHQSFLEVDFNTLDIRVSYMLILSLLMPMVKHSQSNNFAMFLQYLKKEVRDGVYFSHADKHRSFYKLALSFFIEVARHVQNTQSTSFVMQNIQIF